MTKTLAYARISRDPSERRVGVERQRREVKQLAEQLQLTIDAWYEDNDASAYDGKVRPAFSKLLDELRSGRVGVLLAWDQDRLARDVVDWENVLRACQQHGTRVVFVTDGAVDLGTVGGRLSSRVRAVVGRSESEQKSERIRAAVRERAAEGKAHGRVLFGWRREYEHDSNGVQIRGAWRDVLDEAESSIVREAAQRIMAGESIKRITADLNDRGIRSSYGKRWNPAALRHTMLRPANAGLRVHHRQVIGDAEAPPILERGLYDRLVAFLTDPTRRTVTDNRTRHLLTGLALCGVCNTPMRVKGPAYLCPRGCVGRRVAPVDEYVTRVVVARLSQPDALSLLAPDDGAAETAAKEAAALRARLDALVDDYADGILDRAGMKRAAERIRPQLEQAEARARTTSTAALDVLSDIVGRGAETRWRSLSIQRRRAAIAVLLDITIDRTGKGNYREFDYDAIRLGWRHG
jgi:site-specific DNA recombinase